MQHVMTVHTADVYILKSNPPQLSVFSVGSVPTSGWKSARLEPRVYIDPPADGIQDFDFIAEPPVGSALQVIMPITASTSAERIPDWLKGVRIHAEKNQVESMLSDGREVDIS